MIIESLLFGVSVGSSLSADYRKIDALLYDNERCPIYASMTSDTGEEMYATNVMLSSNLESAISESSKSSVEMFSKLQKSFNENVVNKDVVQSSFKRVANQLCRIYADEVLVQYNAYDEALDIQMVLKDGNILSLFQFVNETEELVDFTIRNNKKMLVCGEMPIQELVNNISELTNA